MEPSRSFARQRGLYRALMRLYPRDFRHAYGEPMVQLFGDQLRHRGTRAWLRTVPDLVRTVPTERREAAMARLGTGGRVAALVVIVVCAAVAVVGLGGGGVALVAAAIVIVVLVSQRRHLFGSTGSGGRAPLRRAVIQGWWAPIATLLGVVMIVAGIGTIFEAHNWGGRIVGSALLFAFGATMLFGLTRRPLDRTGGNTLILLATIPALAFFWMVVPPVLAILIWIGALTGTHESPVEPAVS